MAQNLAPKRGTIEARRAWTRARAEAFRSRDEARYRIAERLGEQADRSIPEERGFLVLPPEAIAETGDVADAANEVIDRLGHERLVAEYHPKKETMAREFLPSEARQVGSPYLRFALSEAVLAPVAAYLGLVPILFEFDVWYSPPTERKPRKAQCWHLDGDDTTQVKVWVHCDEIGLDSGPLTAIDAARSEELADAIAYDSSVEYRIDDKKVAAHCGDDDFTPFVGPARTVDFVDTSRCFHFGSRVAPDAPARRVFYAQYVTPYAFKFERDHLDEAPFRHLASETSTELESLVLGAV